MSIPVLIQTYDEVRRLAIAGSVVAPGDFRLQKLLPQLEQAGQKAPVFAKVGASALAAIASTSALCARIAASSAGMKCAGITRSNGGRP